MCFRGPRRKLFTCGVFDTSSSRTSVDNVEDFKALGFKGWVRSMGIRTDLKLGSVRSVRIPLKDFVGDARGIHGSLNPKPLGF